MRHVLLTNYSELYLSYSVVSLLYSANDLVISNITFDLLNRDFVDSIPWKEVDDRVINNQRRRQ